MENQKTPEGKTLEEKAKAAVDYKRQVAVFGEQAATNAVQLWTLGYQSGLQEANEKLVAALRKIKNIDSTDTTDEYGNWDANTHYKAMQKIAGEALQTYETK